MNYSRALASALLMSALATSGAACPWASGTYVGNATSELDFKVTFNTDCTSLTMIDTGRAPMTLPISASAQGWTIRYDTTTITFDTKGKRARARRSGAQRSVRMRQR